MNSTLLDQFKIKLDKSRVLQVLLQALQGHPESNKLYDKQHIINILKRSDLKFKHTTHGGGREFQIMSHAILGPVWQFSKFVEPCTFKPIIYARKYTKRHEMDQNYACNNLGCRRTEY